MSNYSRCNECGDYWYSGLMDHNCPPTWRVVDAEFVGDEGEWCDVRAHDAEDAAEIYARERWEDAPESGDTLDLCVLVDGEPVKFRVTADWSLDVDAREVSS